MAFLIDRGIAAESEEEFDAEGDRYEDLRSRLLSGRTMKYEEMEELLAAAKARNDQKTVGALKNVVDDPPTDGADALSEDDETGRNSIASAAAGRLREGGFDVDVESPTAIRLNGGKTADEDEITSMLSDLGICAQEVSPGVFELDWTDPVAGIADEIEEKFGPEGRDAIIFFEKMKLVETRWLSKNGGYPEKSYHTYYTSFSINAQWPVYEISDVLTAAMMSDEEYTEIEDKILAEVGKDGRFSGDVAEALGLSSTMLKSLVRRSVKMDYRGHRIELIREE